MERKMLTKVAFAAFAVLTSVAALAAPPKERENIQFQVVSSKAKIHGDNIDHTFAYTYLMYTRVSGKNVLYQCDQHGDICPVMEDGKMYNGDQEGRELYVTVMLPDGKKPFTVRYEDVGSW